MAVRTDCEVGSEGKLDSLNLAVLALQPGFHEHGVKEDEHDRARDEPEEDGQRARDEKHREANNAEGNVQLLLRDDERADLKGGCKSAHITTGHGADPDKKPHGKAGGQDTYRTC